MDPTAIQTADLTKTKVDPLAATVRKLLRRNHGFLERGEWGISAVFSTEPMVDPIVFTMIATADFSVSAPTVRTAITTAKSTRIDRTAAL